MSTSVAAGLLCARALSASRGRRVVLEPFDLDITRGETVAVYGPNGAGKSTLLQALAALIPASGRLWFGDRELGCEMALLDYHRRTAAVFQEPLLLRGTVRENVRLGLNLRGKAAGADAAVNGWLERLHIARLADRSVGALSSGEAQRASLARALILEPELLFLDEPFSALDAPTRQHLTEEVAQLVRGCGIATLLVTHDLDEAAALCERCLVVDAGRVLQDDRIDAVLQRPATVRVAQIVGTPNVLDGTVTGSGPHGVDLDWLGHRLLAPPATAVARELARFVVREELIRLSAPDHGAANTLRGTVERVRRYRGVAIVRLRVADHGWLQFRVHAGDRPQEGEAATVRFPPEAIWMFEKADPWPQIRSA